MTVKILTEFDKSISKINYHLILLVLLIFIMKEYPIKGIIILVSNKISIYLMCNLNKHNNLILAKKNRKLKIINKS